MRKILFLFISIILSGSITAQKLDWQERRKAADEIDLLIEKYINTCELSDLGKSEYSTEQAEAFKALFVTNAKITDRLGSQTAEDGGTEVSEQSVEAYTQALMARFPQGMTVKIAKLQADYSQLDQRKARVAIERQFRARDEAGKYVLDTADMIFHLTIDRELEFVKINKLNTEPPSSSSPIKSAEKKLTAQDDAMTLNLKKGNKKVTFDLARNDKNIKNAIYKITRQPERGTVALSKEGIATYTPRSSSTNRNDQFEYEVCDNKNQCDKAFVKVEIIPVVIPQQNRSGFYINPSIAFGVSSNNDNIVWGYETVRNDLAAKLSTNSGTSLNLGVEVDYYFSDNLGIGTGLQYQSISGGFELNDFNAQYASNHYNTAENRSYERILTMTGITEEYTMTNIGVPLLLKFRTHPEKKIGIFAHAGIQYNLSSSSKSTLNTGAMANYEAIRYSANGNAEPTYDNMGEDGKFTWFQTADSYAADGVNVEEHFNELYDDGHNIGINIPLGDGNNSSNLAPHINLLARVGAVYNISQSIALQIGGQYISGTLKANNNYQISDKIIGEGTDKHGEYTSLIEGGLGYSAIGITAGLSIRLGGRR